MSGSSAPHYGIALLETSHALGYRERMGWGFTWASSYQRDFNSDLAFSSGLEQTRKAIEPILDDLPPVAFRNARKAGTDIYGYMTESA